MPQHIRKAGNVFASLVKGRGKKMSEVMWEHLGRLHPRHLTQPFQFIPDLPPCNTFSAFGAKDRAGSDFFFFRVFAQLAVQLGRQQDRADFAFERNFCFAVLRGLNRDLLHLADANAGGADGFHQERETVVARSFRRGDQPFIFCTR